MKSSRLLYISVITAGLLLQSCRARFYTPNRNPIPFFKQKGDVFVDGSTSLAFNKYDLTLGYAVNNFRQFQAGSVW